MRFHNRQPIKHQAAAGNVLKLRIIVLYCLGGLTRDSNRSSGPPRENTKEAVQVQVCKNSFHVSFQRSLLARSINSCSWPGTWLTVSNKVSIIQSTSSSFYFHTPLIARSLSLQSVSRWLVTHGNKLSNDSTLPSLVSSFRKRSYPNAIRSLMSDIYAWVKNNLWTVQLPCWRERK